MSFSQILDLVQKLPRQQKIKLSQELEKEVMKSKLTELLTEFRTDKLNFDEITEEVEELRQELYEKRKRD